MWTAETVAGHTVELFEPQTRNADGFVAIYLHGVHLNRLEDKPAFIAEFEKHGLPVVCPRTERSWWTDRICPEFDAKVTAERYVLDCVVPFIAERYGAKPPKIGLFGTSMGGQGALRLAFKHPNVFPVAVGISPAVDYQERMRYPEEDNDPLFEMYDSVESARQDTATLLVHPLNWPRNIWFCCDPADAKWIYSVDKLRQKLAAIGIPYFCEMETTGGGHSFEYYQRMASGALGYMVEALGREARRV